MAETNRYGLSRKIPAEVSLEVRQRCGFGCVICGEAYIDYDHFDPEFADAKSHSASGITLLCKKHHGLKTGGQISKSKVSDANKDPYCKKNQNVSTNPLEFGETPTVRVQIGETVFVNPHAILRIDGTPLIRIDAPEISGGPFRLSLQTSDDPDSSRIAQNEWLGSSEVWDITIVQQTTTIRSSRGRILLQFKNDPNSSLFTIEKMKIDFKGHHLKLVSGVFTASFGKEKKVVRFSNGGVIEGACPFEITNGRHANHVRNLKITDSIISHKISGDVFITNVQTTGGIILNDDELIIGG
jgi:hypothetical protein